MAGMIARVPAGDVEAAAVAVRTDGVAVLEKLADPARVAALAAALVAGYPGCVGAAALPDDHFKVGEGRYTVPVALAGEFAIFDILFGAPLAPLVASLLGEPFVLEAFGAVVALPGAVAQHRHRDGGRLFDETGLDPILPPVALTFALPLVRFDATSGRTAFHPGTHRFAEPGKDAEAPAADLAPGDAALWDFRVMHFGEANRGDSPRPMLYATFCRPFWSDRKNFVEGRNAKLLAGRETLAALPPEIRARLVRAQLVDA